MGRFFALLALLALCAAPGPISGHETDAAEADQQEAPSQPPARRPKMPGVITFESSLGKVLFPHRVHQRMGCQKCHHQIHAKDLITPHDEYLTYSWVNCRDCHDETQNHSTYYGCAKCHHSNLENIADETLNAKVVVHKSCWKCHLSGTGVKASQRCHFCHLKDDTPSEPSLDIISDATSDPAGAAADSGLE